MHRQDKKWFLGLAGMFVGICLLLSLALATMLILIIGQGNLTEWMMDASKDLRSEIPPLPEARAYEPIHFVTSELSPFDRVVPANSTNNRN